MDGSGTTVGLPIVNCVDCIRPKTVEIPVNAPETSVGEEIDPVKICGPARSRSESKLCDTLKPPPPALLYPTKDAVNWRTVAPCVKVAIALLNVQVTGDTDTGDGDVGSRME